MLDIQFIRENPKLVEEKSKQKAYDVNVSRLLELDEKGRSIVTELENLRAKRNEHAASLKGGKPSEEQLETGKRLKTDIAKLENELEPTEQEFTILHKAVPNMPYDDVPVGASEAENVVVKT